MSNFRSLYLEALSIYPPQRGYYPAIFNQIDLDDRHQSLIDNWITDEFINTNYANAVQTFVDGNFEGDHHILFEALVYVAVELELFDYQAKLQRTKDLNDHQKHLQLLPTYK